MTTTYIAAAIHNNSLGECELADSSEDACEILKGWAEEQFNRPLTNEELADLADSYEFSIKLDSDNVYTFSVGMA